tara:strand:- start:648 stop:1793 length:1146 start_codon:yes stop_codon:yes gene_type:complete
MEVVVTKLNRFRKRVVKCFVVNDECIKTVDPETANVGNQFTFEEFVRAAVDAKDHATFNLVVKQGGRKQTLRYTCASEADCMRLVTELNRSRVPDLDDCEHGWMLKKHPRGTKYQRRFFVLQGSFLRYYDSDLDLKNKKHPVSLDALRAVLDPTQEKGMGPEAFDLVFIDKTFTLTEEDSAQSRRFGAILRALEPPTGAVSLKDSAGVKLLVLECLSCGTLNAVKQKVIEVSKKKQKMLPCSKCHTKLSPFDAQEQHEVKVCTVQCPWCNAWLQYAKGTTEIICTHCEKNLQLADEPDDFAVEDRRMIGTLAELEENIEELQRRIRELEAVRMRLRLRLRLRPHPPCAPACVARPRRSVSCLLFFSPHHRLGPSLKRTADA